MDEYRQAFRGFTGRIRTEYDHFFEAADSARAESAFPIDHLSRIPADSQIELPDRVQPSSLAASPATAVPRQRVFSATSVAWCCDHVAATVTGLIRLEMIERLRTTSGQRAFVSVMWIEAVIHVAMKTRRAVEPRAHTEKYAVNKPIRSVVPIRSTAIRRVIEISIWTDGRNPDIHGDL
jgi:hypothetical protein